MMKKVKTEDKKKSKENTDKECFSISELLKIGEQRDRIKRAEILINEK